jgi:hypothetical protein
MFGNHSNSVARPEGHIDLPKIDIAEKPIKAKPAD